MILGYNQLKPRHILAILSRTVTGPIRTYHTCMKLIVVERPRVSMGFADYDEESRGRDYSKSKAIWNKNQAQI